MQAVNGRCKFLTVVCCVMACVGGRVQAQGSAKDIVGTMLANEHNAAAHKDNFTYVSNERSERTLGRLWTERVVETPHGRVRFLMAEDGKPISTDRVQQERGRLANDVAHPEAFEQREKAQKDDEAHARQMLDLIPKGFILENLKEEGADWRVDFRPDPSYSPSGLEEHVLHGMTGWMLINRKQSRLHHIEGHLPKDLSIGFGLISVRAGSNFESTKAQFDDQWRTARVISDIRGKAVLFKTIAKNQDVARSEFKRVQNDLTVAQAVELVER